ncbi:cytosolic phospholipase A2-like, partial [Paramuricea clavata]
MLRVRTSPNSKQQTTVKSDTYNTVWNESFTFYLNHDKKNTLEVTMKDSDYGSDDMLTTKLELKLLVEYDDTRELRLSYDLCDKEKEFLQKRKEEIFKHMPKIMGEKNAPKNIDEVPVIGIMGSGGGYRAVCGLSGVFCALQESGILDCSTYVTGLSGSS